MSRRVIVGLGILALIALGGWLWSRYGLAVWLDAVITFCM